jgi:hypothetical protein
MKGKDLEEKIGIVDLRMNKKNSAGPTINGDSSTPP